MSHAACNDDCRRLRWTVAVSPANPRSSRALAALGPARTRSTIRQRSISVLMSIASVTLTKYSYSRPQKIRDLWDTIPLSFRTECRTVAVRKLRRRCTRQCSPFRPRRSIALRRPDMQGRAVIQGSPEDARSGVSPVYSSLSAHAFCTGCCSATLHRCRRLLSQVCLSPMLLPFIGADYRSTAWSRRRHKRASQ
jgi:hypothetical protein